jgi:hypothetical protein
MAKLLARKITDTPRTRKSPRALRQARPRGAQVCLGQVVSWDERGPLVDFEGNTRGPLLARVSGPRPGAGVRAAAAGQEVVLLVDPMPARPPVLLGFLAPIGAPPALDARVDGKRVELEGQDEIVLRCGEASITLRRNGRVVIKGAQVETRASGLNRIKGGSVAIN